jgi:hypothetical protein
MANQHTKKKLRSQQNRKEIFWNLINASLAGGLVFLGSITGGNISRSSLCVAVIAFFIVFLTKFKDFWDSEEKDYCQSKIFNFIHL